jgi:hypothetical protein
MLEKKRGQIPDPVARELSPADSIDAESQHGKGDDSDGKFLDQVHQS